MNESLFERLQHASMAALSGLMANPLTLNNDYQRQIRARNLTTEKMAILSGAMLLEELERYKIACEKDEQSKEKKTPLILVDDPPNGSS